VGNFKLDSVRQAIGTDELIYDAKSKSVYGIDVEWRSASGFAAGGELFSYKNKVVSASALAGEQETVVFMVNGKYYWRAASWFYPYAGAGIGAAATNFTGDFTGNSTGLAYQALAGVEFRFGHVGLYLQYKYLSANTKTHFEDEDVDVTLKVGGKGA